MIAIDSAVPRKEEGPSSEEAEDRTPSVAAHAAAAAAQAFNLNNYGRGTVISPTASGQLPSLFDGHSPNHRKGWKAQAALPALVEKGLQCKGGSASRSFVGSGFFRVL